MGNDLRLWYRKPAEQWLEALPIGNGRLGAMVFGGTSRETLQLNESTLWAGGPHDYNNPEARAALPEIRRLVFAGEWEKAQQLVNDSFAGLPVKQMPYQTVGQIDLDFPTLDDTTDYERQLDLNTAITTATFVSDGVTYTREAFSSHPDQVIVLRLTADQPGKITFSAAYQSPQDSHSRSDNALTLALEGISGEAEGIPGTVKFTSLARAMADGGEVQTTESQVHMTNANSVTVLISIATSYRNYADVSGDALQIARDFLDTAARKSYQDLKARHIADYQTLFSRFSLDLGNSDASQKPTNERVVEFAHVNDPELAALHCQYGRYLLISCSRPGGQPATLQGLWNDSMTPPWDSKYTININTEMNYWPTAPANLTECYEPLFEMIAELAETGSQTAKVQYDARGWVAHHNTDGWRGSSVVDGAFWGMWPTGGAWLAKSLWDHYEFTGDTRTLAKHYPILKGAAQFFLDTLVEEPTHQWLVTNPSVSPENAHHPDASICAGPTMDNLIIHDLLSACAKASEILGLDDAFRSEVLAAQSRLAPMQIGAEGQLQEWLDDWDAIAPEQHHRHVSHLYGLYPSSQVTRHRTPELFAAARKSLEQRGDMATGWSLGWKINLWARLEDGDHAYKLLTDLITPERTAPNLFDLHPPFQIDGNFGATSGVIEMLLQSHTGEICLLPALPTVWPTGSVRGVQARGGFNVEIAWSAGQLTKAVILSKLGGPCRVRLGDQTAEFSTVAGQIITLDRGLKLVF